MTIVTKSKNSEYPIRIHRPTQAPEQEQSESSTDDYRGSIQETMSLEIDQLRNLAAKKKSAGNDSNLLLLATLFTGSVGAAVGGVFLGVPIFVMGAPAAIVTGAATLGVMAGGLMGTILGPNITV